MALKTLHRVQITITQNIATSDIVASCQAVATLPEINGTRFAVNLPIEGEGVASLMSSAVAALKEKMAEGGHTVEDAIEDAE